MTLTELERRFPTEEACYHYLASLRWPDGKPTCPRCKGAKVYKLAKLGRYVCKNVGCGGKNGYRFSLLVGTIFENTNVPLRFWFRVIYQMTVSKKGISAMAVRRMLDPVRGEQGSYRTAWYMCHRIRAAMVDEGFLKLTGEVEVDETYVGGKEKNKHRSKRLNVGAGAGGKFAVVGAISRKGNITCRAIERASAETLAGFVNEVVSENVSLVATDENPSYHRLTKQGFKHQTVKHAEGEYVRGVVHTANLDSFWSLLKRGIMGQFHKVSWKYLPLYLNEFSFRHNHRKDADIFGAVCAGC